MASEDRRTQAGADHIHLLVKTGFLSPGAEVEAYTTEAAADARWQDGMSLYQVSLHRPDLRPIYGGPTLLEALWTEMDRLMEGLMTKADAEDGGDRYRAEQLAWVLAIVTDPYNPSMDAIRAETVRRWNESQEGQ